MQQSDTPQTIVARARELLSRNDPAGAIQILDAYLQANPQPPPPRGLHLARGLAQRNTTLALHGFEAELCLDPDNLEARERFEQLRAQMYPTGSSQPQQRIWQTALSPDAIQHFERNSQRCTYRGIPMVKNCFDLAIYPMLLWQIKPATIIEIGTFYGGSAAWLSDLTGSFGLDTHIYSIDVKGMPLLQPPRVTFMQGDGRGLASLLSPQFIDQLARPLLVIEDADHREPTTTAVLNFFHPILRSGEYIVVEDGMSATGPVQALQIFFAAHGNEYEVDARWCDYFGTNVTWCVNGFLRKR